MEKVELAQKVITNRFETDGLFSARITSRRRGQYYLIILIQEAMAKQKQEAAEKASIARSACDSS